MSPSRPPPYPYRLIFTNLRPELPKYDRYTKMDEQAQDHQEVESLDLVGDSADTATKPNNRWTLVELALLFNCADLCLKNNIPWWETIRNLLEGISPQPRTEKASKKKLFKLLCDYHQSVSVTELLQQGTGCLTSENLDKNLLDEIKAQRPRLGLEPLTVRKSGQSSDTNVQTEVRAHLRLHGKANRFKPEIESRVSLKLRLPSVVNDSDDEPEPDGDPQDTDYDDRRSYTSRTTNKSKQGASKQVASESQHEIIQMKGKTGRRTEPALSVKPRQPSRTVHPAATEEPASTREVSSKSDSMPSKKRTAIEAEIIDLSDDESTSKPKQPKLKQRKPNEAPSGTTEPPRPSKAPETLRSKGASNVAPSRPKPNTHRTNPAVMIPTTNSAEIVQLVKDMQNTIESLSKRMDDTDYGWRSVLQEIVLDGKNWTPETKHRLQSLGIIMERDPGNLAVQLLKNFQSNDASNTDYAEQLHALLGRRDYTVKLEFPPATSSKEINQAWQAIRDGIKDAFINYSENSAEGPRLSAVSAGYIACTVDNLFSQAEIPKGLIPSMRAHLESRGAAQSLMSGLFCRWIFHQPDMMCAGKHNELTLKQYKVTLLNGMFTWSCSEPILTQ